MIVHQHQLAARFLDEILPLTVVTVNKFSCYTRTSFNPQLSITIPLLHVKINPTDCFKGHIIIGDCNLSTSTAYLCTHDFFFFFHFLVSSSTLTLAQLIAVM